jgi:hypothetical protein
VATSAKEIEQRLASKQEIKPMALYDSDEAAYLLGIARDKLYTIDGRQLEFEYVGPKRKLRRYWGHALIAYINGGAA